jgi:hypothetical protein
MRFAYVLVVVAGCATTGMQRVPDADWRAMSAADRDAVDKVTTAETTRARVSLQRATDALADAKRKQASKPPTHALATDPDTREQLARVDAAAAAWSRANVAWCEDRLEAARVQIDLAAAEQEARRAETIDQHMRGGDTYDVATYRGQLADAQLRYNEAAQRAAHSRIALVWAAADLASQKEAFAQLIRNSEPPGRSQLVLTGWNGALREGAHRRGLAIVSDSAYLKRPPF